MKKFELKKGGLEIDIQGNIFVVDLEDPDFIQALDTFKAEALKESARLKAYEGDYAEGLRQATAFTSAAIDKILGEGATAKIFEGRKVRFSDTLDIIAFIQNEVALNSDKVAETYTSYANRAQRRAEGKK